MQESDQFLKGISPWPGPLAQTRQPGCCLQPQGAEGRPVLIHCVLVVFIVIGHRNIHAAMRAAKVLLFDFAIVDYESFPALWAFEFEHDVHFVQLILIDVYGPVGRLAWGVQLDLASTGP